MSVIYSTVTTQADTGSNIQFRELDQVLRNAELRRTADLGGWLRRYFEDRHQSRLQKQASPSMTLHRSAAG